MKYIKFTILCFLLVPLAANANKYMVRGKNTKSELIALGLEVRNASKYKGINQINSKAKVLTYEIETGNFKPCRPYEVGVIFFMPPKGILFSAEISEWRKDIYKLRVKDGEADGLIITISCPHNESFAFALVD